MEKFKVKLVLIRLQYFARAIYDKMPRWTDKWVDEQKQSVLQMLTNRPMHKLEYQLMKIRLIKFKNLIWWYGIICY